MIAQIVTDTGTAAVSSEPPLLLSALLVVGALAFVVLLVASIWTILKAGGQPGWHALVPVLNTYSLANAAQLQGCLIVVLTFVPCVNYVTYAYLWWSIGKRFGRGTGFCLGLVFLSPIFVPALAISLQREQRRVAALPPLRSPGALPFPPTPTDTGPAAGLAAAPAAVAAALPPAPVAPPTARVLVDGLEVARLDRPAPGTTCDEHRVFAVASDAPVLEVEVAQGTRTRFDLAGVAEPGATWALEVWVGPAGAAVEGVVVVQGSDGHGAARLVLQPVLLPGAGVTDADLAGHGLSSRGLALDDDLAGSMLACRCVSCGDSFLLDTAPAAAALHCRTGQHTLAVDAPVARPVHPQVASELPPCDACGGDFAHEHPLRCPSCSMPFVDLASHPADLPYETYAATRRGSPLQWFRPAEHGWRAASDGNWYPSSLLG